MYSRRLLRAFFLLVIVAAMCACGGDVSQQSTIQAMKLGSTFVTGGDAPLASVLAFRITITGLTATDGTNTATLISQPQDIEFARLNGLRTLIDINSVPVGTYTGVTATLSSPVISFLDATTTPPSVQTLNGSLKASSITVQLRQPMVVTENGLVGLHMDFRLGSSLQIDSSGQVTGVVDPKIVFHAIPPDAPEAEIDELRGSVVSINTAAGTFVMQGPHGRQLTVATDANTLFEPGEDLSTFDTNTIVEVSGSLQRQTLTLLATSVEVVSSERFLLGGLITDVRPPTGRADHIDLLVRTELPNLQSAQLGHIATLDFDGNERFLINSLRLPLAFFLFNRASLIAGQRVSAGGTLVTSSNPPVLDVRRVTLHRQGLEGGWVVGSTNVINGNTGSFGFQANGLMGVLFGAPVKVFTSDRTRFVNLAGLSDLSGSSAIPLRVVGLVLQDPATGKPVIVAWAVEKLLPLTP
jgi:hypothetical protein